MRVRFFYHPDTKLLLVSIHIDDSPQAVPLGAAMLASAVKAAPALAGRVEPALLDLRLGMSAAGCAAAILAGRPDAVGFSVAVWNRRLAVEIAGLVKAGRPDVWVFAGGPEASADARGLLEESRLDFILAGEAERSLPLALDALIAGRALDSIPGAVWRGPDGTARVSPPAFEAELAGLVSPYLDGTLEPAKYPGLLWELSRGCPFRCDFCFESRGNAGVRRFPLERLEAELEFFSASGVGQVFVLDPTFNVDLKRAKRILRLIGKKAPHIHFSFEVRSEFIDTGLAKLFAGLACSVQIGLQSADPAVLARLGRGFDPEDFQAKVLLLHEADVVYGFDLMYGLPGESLAGFRESIDFALGLMPNHLDLFRLAVLPGTALRDKAVGLELSYLPTEPYTVVETPTFSRVDLAGADGLAEACRLLYVRAGAVPWFQLMLGGLGLKPSQLLADCAAWLADRLSGRTAASIPEDEACALAKEFLAGEFTRLGRPELACVALDLVEWFSLSERLPGLDELAAARGVKAHFSCDMQALIELLEAGVRELAELAFFVPKRPGMRRVKLIDGELCIEATNGQLA